MAAVKKTNQSGTSILVNWTNIVLLAVIILLALLVVYSTHQSRLLGARHTALNEEIKEQKIRHDQLMLEEGTFARTASIERKAREELQLQNISLEQVVRVTP